MTFTFCFIIVNVSLPWHSEINQRNVDLRKGDNGCRSIPAKMPFSVAAKRTQVWDSSGPAEATSGKATEGCLYGYRSARGSSGGALHLTLICWWWQILPIWNDAKNLEIDQNPYTWLLIWDHSARAIHWIPTWQDFKIFAFLCFGQSSLSIGRVNPSNAKSTFVQCTMMQIFLENI